jgi:hypothetical protein
MLDKYLKNIGLKGRQIISLSGAPTCLHPALGETPASPMIQSVTVNKHWYMQSGKWRFDVTVQNFFHNHLMNARTLSKNLPSFIQF